MTSDPQQIYQLVNNMSKATRTTKMAETNADDVMAAIDKVTSETIANPTKQQNMFSIYAAKVRDYEAKVISHFLVAAPLMHPSQLRAVTSHLKLRFPNFNKLVRHYIRDFLKKDVDDVVINAEVFLSHMRQTAANDIQRKWIQEIYNQIFNYISDDDVQMRRQFGVTWTKYLKQAKRDYILAATQYVANGGQDITLERAVAEADKVFTYYTQTHPRNFADYGVSILERAVTASGEKIGIAPDIVIPTGIHQIDKYFRNGGFENGHVFLIEAYRGIGKTAFLIHLLVQALDSTDRPILFVSLEQPSKELQNRFLQSKTGYTYSELQNTVEENVKAILGRKDALLDDTSIAYDVFPKEIRVFLKKIDKQLSWFTGRQGGSLADIAKEVKYLSQIHGVPPILFIDYLQLIHLSPNTTIPEWGIFEVKQQDFQRKGQIVNALVNYARQENALVIVSSQVNKDSSSYGSQQPEHSASAVLLLEKPEGDISIREIYFQKNRIGPQPTIPARTRFLGEVMRFIDDRTALYSQHDDYDDDDDDNYWGDEDGATGVPTPLRPPDDVIDNDTDNTTGHETRQSTARRALKNVQPQKRRKPLQSNRNNDENSNAMALTPIIEDENDIPF